MNPYDILFGNNQNLKELPRGKKEPAPTFQLGEESSAEPVRRRTGKPAGVKKAKTKVITATTNMGATAVKQVLKKALEEELRGGFIAFDTETTGFSEYNDRLIEIGAVLYENGKPVKEFNTLVNPRKRIPYQVSRINHITDAMVQDAPYEEEAMLLLADFFGDAMQGGKIVVAHNAAFDMKFLTRTLMRCGMDAGIRYVDTLGIARKKVSNVENYKLGTLAEHFGLINEDAHRASADARVCGDLLLKML